ncbi:MAG: hypothetical protein FWD98_00735 [Defluviitaleaceae bacterium]|nr:hypothetical protein [Defluviitaleaceae bacterium]
MNGVSRENCLRCEGTMLSRGCEQIQLGKTGWFMGSWGNLIAGALEVEVFACGKCGKMEFYCNSVTER